MHTSTPQIVQKYLYALLTYQHTTKSAIVPLCAAAASLEDCFSCSSLQSHPPALSAIFRCRESEAPCTQAQVSPCTNSKVFVHKQWSVFAHAYTCSTSSLLRAYYPLQKSTNSQSLLTCRHKFKCLCTQAQVSPKHMRTSLSGGFSKEKKLSFFMPPPKRSCSCNGKSQVGQLGQEASKQKGKEEGKPNILLKLSCCTACQFVQQAKHTRLSLERQLPCLMPGTKANGYTHTESPMNLCNCAEDSGKGG